MRKSNKLLIGGWIFILFCVLGGGFGGLLIIEKVTGHFPKEFILPILGGTLLGIAATAATYLFHKWRNGAIPDFDERSLMLLKRYFLIVLYIFFIGSSLALLTLFAFGVETIETGMLIFVLAVVYLVVGLGALVVKRL